MQGYLQTNLIVYLSQVVGFIGAVSLFRLLSDLLGDVVVSFVVGFIGRCRWFVCFWIYWAMSVVVLVVGFIGAMSLFGLLSDLLGNVGGCTCCWIYWVMSVFTLVVGFIGQCWRECL